ncbi:hypothetical protein [Limosilactobacillus sp.]|uniref:hypothetical protein n=1 Tax=Limosilactobacillus sp. TaxID=2773925 RepID=UPI0025C155C5|nr:hypothetical protein [Limosilactobacillus sp.]MCH3921913.1 hypothetical protein [Limosilactobacillus sp.]MCH3928684.1 hypothetical protein [Limosilactobacillus sp.]
MFNCKAVINDQTYTPELLEWIFYQRTIYTLHEMKRLGAEIKDGNRILSDSDINFLGMKDAKRISIAVRQELGIEGVKKLYADALKNSDAFWKNIHSQSGKATAAKEAYTYLKIEGITMQDMQKVVRASGSEGDTIGYVSHPEHFFVTADAEGNRGMETMGMYGEPVDEIVVFDQSLDIPKGKDPEYPLAMTSYTKLASDGTPTGIRILNQFKPADNGLELKLSIFFPEKTPDEMVFGHEVHLAIEFYEMAKQVYATK